MNKLRENFRTMWLATRYSFAFCWKNDRKNTQARLIFSALVTFVAYLNVQSLGFILNAIQTAHGKIEVLYLPVGFIVLILFTMMIANRANEYYKSQWYQELRDANGREVNQHRARLDVGTYKSKRYDDLDKQIRELPYSWSTRVTFSEQMLSLFTLVISFVSFGASLLWYKPIYALILLVVAVPKLVSEFNLVAMWWKLYEKHIPHYKKMGMLKKPYFGSSAFIQAKVFNQMNPLGVIVEEAEAAVREEYRIARRNVAFNKIFTSIFALAGLCAVIYHASTTAILTGAAVGTAGVIISSSITFQNNLNSIVMTMADQWNSAKGILLIENDFFGLIPDLKTLNPIQPEFKNPSLRFDRVSFAYPNTDKKDRKEVLHEVSFEIPAGKKTAIVGQSGNGKSTVLALLMRHYDPLQGAVYADDINLQNIEPHTWNEFISPLNQHYDIHERLVGEEIASSRLGEPIDIERVEDAARFAHFHDVVMEEAEGYNRQIGSDFDGREFSGGEEQRLAMARMYYRNTPILIFDEPDARLDPDSAQRIMNRIFALPADKTVIIITHHVSRAEHCDHIIVMGKGTVAEQGTYAELMARNGVYARMCESDKRRLGTLDESGEAHSVSE